MPNPIVFTLVLQFPGPVNPSSKPSDGGMRDRKDTGLGFALGEFQRVRYTELFQR